MKKILTSPDKRFQALFSRNFEMVYQEPIWQYLTGGKMSNRKMNEFLSNLSIVPINISKYSKAHFVLMAVLTSTIKLSRSKVSTAVDNLN